MSKNAGYLPSIPFLFTIITFILVIGLLIFPILYSVYLSLGDLGGPGEYIFKGLDNYIFVLEDPLIPTVLFNTFYFVVGFMIPVTVFGLALALLANENFRGNTLFRASLLIPYAISPIVNGVMWKWFYNVKYGMFNWYLVALGVVPRSIHWLDDPAFAMPAVIIAEVWKLMPFFAILFLARLQTIPSDLYESAKIDGAGKIGRFFDITLPSLKSTSIIIILIEIMWSFRIFATILVLTHGGPNNVTNVLSYYGYLSFFKYHRWGYGSVIGIMNALLILVVAVVYFRMMPKEEL